MERIVLLECGHWFRESGPDGTAASSPRVCSAGADGNPDSHRRHPLFGGEDRYPLTGQGLPLVPVTHYIDPNA